ncbi:E3 ubiquitin-protein ligase ZSWIM2 isoform X1 [Sphaerodactylus townsendi]|uniref:E3 ubiquitin-protein ligase ZSWIM2 isoform X1 n=1 Tax=Sphaerodactylus townsendi TaxID=933632 RepID=UPI002025E56F|nr:E3 ubiquitin-protein ligase ZSWIM2 isoform X1 [Sphaerodactylus townsendi]
MASMLQRRRRRPTATPKLSWRQDQALGSTMRIVRVLGPTAFVLQEEEEEEQLRVFLGNPHSCSCSTFEKEKDLCKHICWLLLKKFKLPRDHEYALKLGLVEREINHVLQDPQNALQPKAVVTCTKELQTAGDGFVKQKEIENEGVCPICQDVLFRKMLPVTYCRFGCGNNVHIVCMKIWADHQEGLERDSLVKCPLCREDFAPLRVILEEFRNCRRLVTAAEKQPLDRHLGVPCNNCRLCPIEGNCYKCTECPEYHLCHCCFRSVCHPSHTFVFREKRNQKWKSAKQNLKSVNPGDDGNEERDKEKMRYLMFNCTPERIINSLPTVLVRKSGSLLGPGLQCRLCLKIFCLGQVAKFLPCNHKFHRKCIDHWLRKENGCPIDGHVVYNPLTQEDVSSRGKETPSATQAKNQLAEQTERELFALGTGLFIKGINPSSGSEKSQIHCNKKKSPSEFEQDLTLNSFSHVHTRSADSGQGSVQKTGNLKFSRYLRGLALVPRSHLDTVLGTNTQKRSMNTFQYFKSLN